MQTLKINAAEENKGERLDKFIADNSDISRSYAAKLCEDGLVLCGEKQLLKKYKILGTEEITINVPEPEELSIEPENIPLNIVYEDSDVIVVNKPQGLCVHPAPGNERGTLVNGLVYHCGDELSAINGVIRPGIVHRIDKDTSGLLIVAKNNEAHLKLSEQLKERKAMRKYVALVNGNIKEDSGTINKPIGRNPSDRKKMAVVFGGREAVTHFNVLERFGQYTLVECILETGRTHQIRVHMASIGHSIVGDTLYGIKKEKFNLNGQLLHAKTIGFVHPRTGKMMKFTSDIPEYFENVLEKLRKR
jgi:23S rRNA pseudouridine1911/1915/1917 synthase